MRPVPHFQFTGSSKSPPNSEQLISESSLKILTSVLSCAFQIQHLLHEDREILDIEKNLCPQLPFGRVDYQVGLNAH